MKEQDSKTENTKKILNKKDRVVLQTVDFDDL